jgi:hypothetical protein
MRSRKYVGVSLALVMAFIGSAVATPVVAEAASAPSLTVSPTIPTRGKTFKVSGRLSSKVVRPVTLQYKSGSAWKTLVSARTAKSGKFSVSAVTKASSLTVRVVARRIKVKKKTYAKVITKTKKITTTAASTTTNSSSCGGLASGSWTGTIGTTSVTLQGAYLVDGTTVSINSGTCNSTTAGQAVFLVVNGGNLTVTNSTLAKSGTPSDSSSDDYNFFGKNSVVVVVGATSSASISGSKITATSAASNAVFATKSATATVTDTTITTTQDSSRGLDATYSGKITASGVNITTQGAHCAALATDRGNGTVTVSGTNTLTTNGADSPVVYSTGAITLSGATGTATQSEAVVVEGKNGATVTDSTLVSGGTNAVLLYQSASGDASDSDSTATSSTFTLSGSTLTHTGTAASGAVIWATNTATSAYLTNDIITSDSTTYDLKAYASSRWGTSGSNGATMTVSLDDTTLSGAYTDSISSITVNTSNDGALNGSTSGSVTLN